MAGFQTFGRGRISTFANTIFEFDAKHRLHGFTNAGNDFVSTRRVDELDTLLDDHPNWRPEEKAAAVRTAGAKFGPADEARMFRRRGHASPL